MKGGGMFIRNSPNLCMAQALFNSYGKRYHSELDSQIRTIQNIISILI